MAETTITLARTAAAVIDQAYPSNHSGFADGTVITNAAGAQRILLAQFEQLASAYKNAKLIKATLGGGADAVGNSGTLAVSQAGEANLSTVTWETQPIIDSAFIGYVYVSRFSPQRNSFPYPFPKGKTPTSAESIVPIAYTAKEASEAARQLLRAETLAIWSWKTAETAETSCAYREGASSITTPASYTPFNLYVIIDPAVTIQNTVQAKDDTPRTGYMSPYEAHTFAWDFVSSDDTYTCFGGWEQASATFYYRNGTSGSYTSVALTSAMEVTLPASTFAVGSFQWYVTATDTDGRTTTSPVYTLSTTDAEAVATPLEPIGTIEDGGDTIVLKWSVSSNYGSAPTGADLQKSADGSIWTTFAQPRTAATEYSAAAGTFSGGKVYWRVRALNADGTAGSWSSAVQFVCYAAPNPPIVSVDAKPYAAVTWQSEGQQAFEVLIDGVSVVKQFGETKDFSLLDPLTDGAHVAEVRIQNQYGLWSAPGSADFTVTNVPGAGIVLSASVGVDAQLSWTAGSDTGNYMIYRDGERIAHASAQSFTDRVVLGTHTWYVLEKLPGGYYTKSNVVVKTCAICCPQIAPLSGGPWVAVDAARDPVVKVHHARERALTHYRGLRLPVVEWGGFEDETVTINAVFECEEKAARFRELFGQTVIIKTYRNRVFIAALPAYDEDMELFHGVFNLTAESVDWGDYIDATEA